MTEHIVGRCDICHKDFKFLEMIHGIIHDINMITRYCDECWKRDHE